MGGRVVLFAGCLQGIAEILGQGYIADLGCFFFFFSLSSVLKNRRGILFAALVAPELSGWLAFVFVKVQGSLVFLFFSFFFVEFWPIVYHI